MIRIPFVRYEVLMVVKILIVVFCVVMLCGLIGGCQRFRGMYCFHLQGEVNSPHGITTQKTTINMNSLWYLLV
jgi:hypothetical protein